MITPDDINDALVSAHIAETCDIQESDRTRIGQHIRALVDEVRDLQSVVNLLKAQMQYDRWARQHNRLRDPQ